MLKIDSKAGDAFDRLVIGPLRTIVPIVGVIAFAFNLVIPGGSLAKVIDAMLLTAAVTSGHGFALWVIGMGFDFVGVFLKFLLQGFLFIVVAAIRGRRHVAAVIRERRELSWHLHSD